MGLPVQLRDGRRKRLLGRLARRRLGRRLHRPRHQWTLLAVAQAQRIAHEVHLAALLQGAFHPGDGDLSLGTPALRVPLDRLHHAGMIAAHNITHAAKQHTR